uniref:Uncharacterized protein n=1 Tax=Cyprinus carpio TaxID=7962 RepID=A0A8C2I1N6_CYPCA
MSRAADRLKVVLNHLDRSNGAVVSFQRRVYHERPAYTFDTGVLTPEQRLAYEENGILVFCGHGFAGLVFFLHI